MIIDRRCNAGLYLYYELALVQAHLFGWHRLLCFVQRMATGVMELQFGCRREIKFGRMMLQAAMASMRVQAQSPGSGWIWEAQLQVSLIRASSAFCPLGSALEVWTMVASARLPFCAGFKLHLTSGYELCYKPRICIMVYLRDACARVIFMIFVLNYHA